MLSTEDTEAFPRTLEINILQIQGKKSSNPIEYYCLHKYFTSFPMRKQKNCLTLNVLVKVCIFNHQITGHDRKWEFNFDLSLSRGQGNFSCLVPHSWSIFQLHYGLNTVKKMAQKRLKIITYMQFNKFTFCPLSIQGGCRL